MIKQQVTSRPQSERVQRKHKQARQDILEVAERILSEGGIEAVTLASVAGELSMTKQALYHYFASKEALVRSLGAGLRSHAQGGSDSRLRRAHPDPSRPVGDATPRDARWADAAAG